MIPTTAPGRTMEAYTANIIRTYRRATYDQVRRGATWYQTAHDLADMLAHGDVRTGAGVLAALSPQTGWGENITRARHTLTGGHGGHTRDSLGKARRIMAGEDPADVLPHDRKTWHFFRAILDPTDPTAVVIDRHAHDIAADRVYGSAERGLQNRTRYATLVRAYVIAAGELGIVPSAVQATTWIVWRAEISGTGTRQDLAA